MTSSERRHIPSRLTLQWHLTDRCNLRCRHCYQEDRVTEELDLPHLRRILDQYVELLRNWREASSNRPIPGRIHVTGGEPFLRGDFWEFLSLLAEQRQVFRFAILTNGTLVDSAAAKRLRRLGPAYVQVSLDGLRETHDAIRGNGAFDRAVSGIKRLVRSGVRTLISFAAHAGNYREFPQVARLGRSLGVAKVWTDRVVPWGRGRAMQDQLLTPDQTREYCLLVDSARRHARRSWFTRTEVAAHRALQFLTAGGVPYRCTAGDSLLTVMPDGELYPCRRMPISIGNVLAKPLRELYYDSEVLCNLRDPKRLGDACAGCSYAGACRGGLRCLAYALTGDPMQGDPGCWLA